MFDRWKKQYRRLCASPPGKRFQELHERRHEGKENHARWLPVVGVILIGTGLLLLFLPGPGIVFLLAGLGIFAQELAIVARALDATELRFRQWFGVDSPKPKS